MAEAEANGGSNFRQQYRDANVFALLGHFGYFRGNLSSENLIFSQKWISLSQLSKNSISVGTEQLIPQNESTSPQSAVWAVEYYSDSAWVDLLLFIDALTGNIVSIDKPDEQNLADRFTLHQNYPNPFNPSTTIRFDLPQASQVTLKVFNTLGEEVTTLVSGKLSAGFYSYQWDASNLASGIYLCNLQVGSYIETMKMMLLK
ncbi:MAG: T9SS type A sorting domain-containing protein [Calditrichota bacterium]